MPAVWAGILGRMCSCNYNFSKFKFLHTLCGKAVMFTQVQIPHLW